jgi:hypothetical protein
VGDYVGQIIPLRITDDPALAVPARLEAVDRADFGGSDHVLLTFDLIGGELLRNVLTNERSGPGDR